MVWPASTSSSPSTKRDSVTGGSMPFLSSRTHDSSNVASTGGDDATETARPKNSLRTLDRSGSSIDIDRPSVKATVTPVVPVVAVSSKMRPQRLGYFTLTTLSVSSSIKAYARSPITPRAATDAASSSSPSIDFTGYLAIDRTVPTTLAAISTSSPLGQDSAAVLARCMDHQLPMVTADTRSRGVTHSRSSVSRVVYWLEALWQSDKKSKFVDPAGSH